MRRRNTYHPEGAPDAWGSDQPVWPPREQPSDELEGETLQEKLQSALSFVDGMRGIEARIRACLLAEGLPDLYAEYVASEVAEGWANGDPAPLYTAPGYVPPQNDPEIVRSSPELQAAVDAWRVKWDSERRGNPSSSRWKLTEITPSQLSEKKWKAVFENAQGRSKTVHFGAAGYEDYTTHRDPRRKARYLERHGRGREDWRDPTTAGALSRWILWNKPTLKASIDDFRRRFKL